MSDLEISGNTYHSSRKRGGDRFYNNPFIMLAIGGAIVAVGYIAYRQLSNTPQSNSTIDPQQLYNMQLQQHLMNEEMRREAIRKQQMMAHVNPNNPYASQFLESNVGGGPSLIQQLQQNPALAHQMTACKPINTSAGQKMNEYEHMMQQRQNEYTNPMRQQHETLNVPMGYNPGLSPGMGNMTGPGTEKLASLFVNPPP